MSLRAMFSSISGLQSDSQWLDVIGNNIANSNTVGYKSSRVEFADQFSQALLSGSAGDPSRGIGGNDPQEIGLGTRVASIQTLFQPGSVQETGISTDLSIQGDGFLLAKKEGQTYLTRAGNLTFDSQGNLVDPNGGLIQGFNAQLRHDNKIINSAANIAQLGIQNADLQIDATGGLQITNIQIQRDMTMPPKATTEIDFKGNLDSFQQPNVLALLTPNGPNLPIGLSIGADLGLVFPYGPGPFPPMDATRMVALLTPTALELQQVANLSTTTPGFNVPAPLENNLLDVGFMKLFNGSYVWDQQPPIPPAHEASETVYDSLGNPRQITIQFYQVNDLGSNGINNPAGPSQVCYAWYAFDTSGGKTVSTPNLLGGTGIYEGDIPSGIPFLPDSYDRGNPGTSYFGDFLWFNTDGSLASSGGGGGVLGPPGLPTNFEVRPRIYLPPDNVGPPPVSPFPTLGAEITAIDLNFGTYGLLGQGKRDGVYSDAEGSYQVVNGVSTYVPKSTIYASSQDGYQDGILQGLAYTPGGTIQGAFSNGQTVALAQLALAMPQNEEGMTKMGGNGYTLSPDSGPLFIGLPGEDGLGTIQGNSLEGSNVDLTVELSNMIIAQRGFDTNARMISVVNQTMDTLSHLGQGG